MSLFEPRRFTAMMLKETRQILRDPSTLLIAFALPPVLLFLFGYAVNLDTARTRIGLALLDSSEAAQSLTTDFVQSRWFDVDLRRSVEPLKAEMVAGRVRGIVVIPTEFGRDVAKGGGQIQIVTDGSLPNTASFVGAYADGVRANWAAGRVAGQGERRSAAPLSVSARYWFNADLTSRNFLVPGAMAIVLTVIGTLLTALVIAREWERGTMEAIMATPLSMAEFIATKVVPYLVLGLGSALICVLLAVTAFGVPFRGSPGVLFLVVLAFMIPALGQGLLISAATKNQFVASQIALLTAFLPALELSGFLYELSSMPKWIQWLSYAVPVRYLMPMLQTVFLAGDVWPLIIPNLLALLAFGALFFALTVRVTRRRIA